MAENVEEIARLLERIKKENKLNAEDFNRILFDIKNRLENVDGGNAEIRKFISGLKDTVQLKISDDNDYQSSVANALKQIGALLEKTPDMEDYNSVREDINTLTENFKQAVESIVKFANQDTDAKNVLMNKISNLEENSDKINKNLPQILNDGIERLNTLNGNLSEAMNSNFAYTQSTLDSLKNSFSDYFEQANMVSENSLKSIEQNFLDNSNIQNTNKIDILNGIKTLGLELDGQNKKFKDNFEDKFSQLVDILEGYKSLATKLNEVTNTEFATKFSELGEQLKQAYSAYNGNLIELQSNINDLNSVISQVSNSVVMGVVNSNSEVINELKSELLSSSGSNFDTIMAKLEQINGELIGFKDTVSNNLTEYLTAIKDNFVDYTNKMESSMRDDEIVEKLQNLEGIIYGNNEERKNNFNSVIGTISECQNSLNSIQNSINETKDSNLVNFNDLKVLVTNTSNKEEIISSLTNLINERSYYKDEQLRELKGLVEHYNISITDNINNVKDNNERFFINLEELKSEIVKNAQDNSLWERFEQLINERSNEKNQKFDDLRNIICDYKNSIENFINDRNLQEGNILSELHDIKNAHNAIIPQIENLQNLEDTINSSSQNYGSILNDRIEDVKGALREIIQNIQTQFEQTTPEITNKLEALENVLNESAHAYHEKIDCILNNTNLYNSEFDEFKNAAYSKLDTTLGNLEQIRDNFDTLFGKMSTLVGDSGLIEILANIRQQFNIIIEQIHNEKEDLSSNLEGKLKEGINSISSNLYLIGQNLEEVRVKQGENADYLRENFEGKMLGLQADIENISKNLKENIDEKGNSLIGELEPVKNALNELLSLDFGHVLADVKGQIEVSYAGLIKDIPSSILDNEKFINIENSYQNVVEKLNGLESFVRQTSDNAVENLNNSIVKINSVVQNNFELTENLQNALEADLIRIQNSIHEYNESTKQTIAEKLEEIKQAITEKQTLGKNDLQSVIAPLLDNQEVLDVIRTINKNLAEKLEEFSQDSNLAAQDILDIINSVSNTVNYTLDVINEKFEAIETKNKEFADKLAEINSKLDIFAMDNNSEVLDEISGIKDTLQAMTQKPEYESVLNSINSKIDVLAMSDDSEITDGLQEILDFLNDISDKILSKENFENAINNLNQKLETLSSASETTELKKLVTTIDNKLDIIAQSDDNDLFDSIDSVGEKIDKLNDLHNEYQENINNINNQINDLHMGNCSTAETLAQVKDNLELISGDNSQVIEKLDDINDIIENKFNDTNNSISNGNKTIEEKLDKIKSDTESNTKLEDLISTLHNKVDILAMADDSDIQDEITEIKELIEDQISNENSKNADELLHKLYNQLSNVDFSKQAGEIKESIISAVVSLTNEISFVEETEEIKDFVSEKTNDLHRTLMDVKHQLATLTCSGDDMDFYSYTLQDVESDLAKLRLILKDMSGEASSTNEICLISNNISKISKTLDAFKEEFYAAELKRENQPDLNEHIVSISARLNKLILNKKDVDSAVLAQLDATRNKLEQMDTTILTKGIEKVLVSMDEKLSYSANLNTVLKNVMMYLGEWMDGTTETISSIYDKTTKINNLNDAITELRKCVPDKQDLIDVIDSRFDEQNDRIADLEHKLEKLSMAVAKSDTTELNAKIGNLNDKIEKLSTNIEKLAAYVE